MKEIIIDEQFKVVVSLRFAPSYKRKFIPEHVWRRGRIPPPWSCDS
jgi:hypothetical protein